MSYYHAVDGIISFSPVNNSKKLVNLENEMIRKGIINRLIKGSDEYADEENKISIYNDSVNILANFVEAKSLKEDLKKTVDVMTTLGFENVNVDVFRSGEYEFDSEHYKLENSKIVSAKVNDSLSFTNYI